jgi:hypothetical protein
MRLPKWFKHSKSLARSLLEAGKGIKAVLQRAGTREAGLLALFTVYSNDKPSVQPPAKRIADGPIGPNRLKIKRKGRSAGWKPGHFERAPGLLMRQA